MVVNFRKFSRQFHGNARETSWLCSSCEIQKQMQILFTFRHLSVNAQKNEMAYEEMLRITHLTNESRGMTILQIKCSKVREIHKTIFGPVQTKQKWKSESIFRLSKAYLDYHKKKSKIVLIHTSWHTNADTAGILIKKCCSRMLWTWQNRDEHTKTTLMKRCKYFKSRFELKHMYFGLFWAAALLVSPLSVTFHVSEEFDT